MTMMPQEDALAWMMQKYHNASDAGQQWVITAFISHLTQHMLNEANQKQDWIRAMGLHAVLRGHSVPVGCDADSMLAAVDEIERDEQWKPVLALIQSIPVVEEMKYPSWE